MKVLVTGAFGNVGTSAVEQLLQDGHQVRCFDLPTQANRKAAQRLRRRYGTQITFAWGDLRNLDDVTEAVRDQDTVVHLAFIIPKLSATGIDSETRPDFARQINVGGTRNLIAAMKAQPRPPRVLFTSSLHVYGETQHLPPPRTVQDPLRPTDHYSRHKVLCEQLIRTSGLEWLIFRLAATLPIALRLDPGMFDVPLDNRIEFVHTRDVGLAIANALRIPEAWGRVLLIGGGPRCQYTYREMVQRILEAIGIGMLPEEAFSTSPFSTDWLDTRESEALLAYQIRDLSDYIEDMLAVMGLRRYFIRVFRPFIRSWLLRRSPYYGRKHRPSVASRRLAPRIS